MFPNIEQLEVAFSTSEVGSDEVILAAHSRLSLLRILTLDRLLPKTSNTLAVSIPNLQVLRFNYVGSLQNLHTFLSNNRSLRVLKIHRLVLSAASKASWISLAKSLVNLKEVFVGFSEETLEVKNRVLQVLHDHCPNLKKTYTFDHQPGNHKNSMPKFVYGVTTDVRDVRCFIPNDSIQMVKSEDRTDWLSYFKYAKLSFTNDEDLKYSVWDHYASHEDYYDEEDEVDEFTDDENYDTSNSEELDESDG